MSKETKSRKIARIGHELGLMLQIYSSAKGQNYDNTAKSWLEESLLNDPDFYGMVVSGTYPGLKKTVEDYYVSRGYKRNELPWRI